MSFMEIKRFVNSGNTPLNNYIDTEIKKKINSDEDKALDVIIRELCKKPFYTSGLYRMDVSSSSLSSLQYNFYHGSAVVYNNEIHILGSGDSSYYTNHYKWDGSSWESVSTLPYNFYHGSAVVYNNEIHILGGSSGTTAHYKWNGSSWTSVSTLPYRAGSQCSTVVLHDDVHILGGSGNPTAHYKWNGSSWTSVSTLPYGGYQRNSAIVAHDAIFLFGLGDYSRVYAWVGASWCRSAISLSDEWFDGSGSLVEIDDYIYVLGGVYDNSAYRRFFKYACPPVTYKGALPSGVSIHINDIDPKSVIPLENCIIQPDLSLKVVSDGCVRFGFVDGSTTNYYSIY